MSGANECSTTPVIQQDPNRALMNLRKAHVSLMAKSWSAPAVAVMCRSPAAWVS
jgi:hypothetical protein